ncbi:hypothetical protein C900_02170 [Fulvivirga imtechensis AK7]|uniref:Uncharacterized protein n=1 Tax=Fulvivirga imtechensis AK7 TaxID=1237149 RepID=L8JSH9_9BACT|nr:hypothetical protein [Fulvivirga imtechensis]ELR71931.1 hypothetical protein C900_02170 [Fulvivirga imtechensis AK7]
MELITRPREEYLLNASLESLHEESREWLQEIGFWKDEMAFFYKLLQQKKNDPDFPAGEIAALEKEQLRIDNVKIDAIKGEVKSHEKALASLFKVNSLQEEEGYRQMHKRLLKDMYDVHILVRNLKKEIFSMVQKYER